MFSKNMGGVDRGIRITLGIVLLSLVVIIDGPVRFVGLVGLVPLLTSTVGWCPIYAVFGMRTCPVQGSAGSR